jgi:ribosomal protein L40E
MQVRYCALTLPDFAKFFHAALAGGGLTDAQRSACSPGRGDRQAATQGIPDLPPMVIHARIAAMAEAKIPDKLCELCGQMIVWSAQKCHRCGSFQDWRHNLFGPFRL